jgi:crotonobetainyl-CoA:carnitine CoA-transferase CaiB-like acyl-CoA transferase
MRLRANLCDMTDAAPAEAPALAGVTVLDLGQYYQAPYAGLLLALAGADVVKVESLQGEPMRRPDRRASFAQAMLNSNKRGITLNLKHARGVELLLRLVERADVLIENFAPGVMDRLGVGWSTLRERNARLIYATGTGPDRDGLALDAVIQAHGGLTAITGPTEGVPYKAGGTVVDFLGGSHLYAGIVTALYARTRSGRGRLVEVALQEVLYPTLTSSLATLHYQPGSAARQGNRNSVLAPYNLFPTRDGHVMLMCTTDDHWQRLLVAMERLDLKDDPRFAKNKARMQNLAETEALVEAWTTQRTRAEVFVAAKRCGVAAASVRSLEEVMRDPHMHERGMLRSVEHPDLGTVVLPASPIRYDQQAVRQLNSSPGLGAHNAEIYGGWLAIPDSELDELRRDGVI